MELGAGMKDLVFLVVQLGVSVFRSRAALHAENLALRHQINVLKRSVDCPKLQPGDRIFWSFLSKV